MRPQTDSLPRFTDLTLILTDQCNLSCRFCYVPRGGPGRRMPRELALQAVDLLLDRAPPGAPLSVSFFGGEPLLELELMQAVIEHGLARRPDLRFSTPTNGTLLEGAALELVRKNPFRLALSVDPGGVEGHDLARLEQRLEPLREVSDIVRMTVTPDNVEALLETIQLLFARGFTNIMHQPALERPWPAAAKEAWRAQHEAIADWACERYRARASMPQLTVLEGIVSRLERGLPAGFCGAGSTQLAVDPEGRVFGCFRSAYDPRAEQMVLADLVSGAVNEPLIAAYARLDPARARPEGQTCKACDARDGCTVYCPASGHALCGDLRAVPADACTLMQIQVETCRAMLRRMRRDDRARRRRVGAQVTAAALAVGLAGGLVGCDDDTTPGPDSMVGGVCPVQVDGAVKQDGAVQHDGPVGGVCPVQVDSGPKPDAMVGGVCPVMPDQGVKQDGVIVPGQCPVTPDQGAGLDVTIGPGLCPVMPDQGVNPDGPVGGLCPAPGLCPTPGLC